MKAADLVQRMIRKAFDFAEMMQRGQQPPSGHPWDQSVCWYCKGSGRAPEGGDCYMCNGGRTP